MDHVLDGGSAPPWEGAKFGGEWASHCKVQGLSAVLCANRLNQARRGWSDMPGYVRQNDTDFTLLQEEVNAPLFRPLRKRGGGKRWGTIDLIEVYWPALTRIGYPSKLGSY